MIKIIVESVSFISDVFGVIASSLAIYLFFFKKESIKSVFNLLINYGIQLTLTELRSKLDSLNDLRVDDNEEQREQIINLLSDIYGQLKGNKQLSAKCPEILNQLLNYIESPDTLEEPKKRILVGELREILRNIDFQNYDKISGGIND